MNNPLGILRLLLIFALFVSSGCDWTGERGEEKTQAKDKEEGLLFVDSSIGLPLSGKWRQGLCFYDVNGDGRKDILAPPPRKASKENQKPFLWYGHESGIWKNGQLEVPSDIEYDYGAIGMGDFDGDNIADMALAMHGQGMTFLKGAGKDKYVTFSNSKVILSPKAFMSRALVTADFDHDGLAEVAAVSEAKFGKSFALPSGPWIFGVQNNQWQGRPLFDKSKQGGLFADQIVTGDVNGDGHADIGIASLYDGKNLIIWVGDGKGGFTPFNEGLIKRKTYLSVALGDVNGDGRDDLIASITGFGKKGVKGLKCFLSRPEGFEESSEGLPENELFTSICAGDLDGKGGVEVVGVTGQGGVKIFRYIADRWVEAPNQGLPKSGLIRTYNSYCIDLNGDGYKDIALNYSPGESDKGGIKVFLNMTGKKSTDSGK